MLKAEAAGSPKGRAVAQVVPGEGGAVSWVARNTGSHCGEQATPRTGPCVFELRGKAAQLLGLG